MRSLPRSQLTAYTASSAAALVVDGQTTSINSIDDVANTPGAKLCIRKAMEDTFLLRYPGLLGKTIAQDKTPGMLADLDSGLCVAALVMKDSWDNALAADPAHCNKVSLIPCLPASGGLMLSFSFSLSFASLNLHDIDAHNTVD